MKIMTTIMKKRMRANKMSEQFYKCPKCGSESMTSDRMQTDDDSAWCTTSCDDCDFVWHEVYTFSHNEDFMTSTPLDEKGNPIKPLT